MRCKYSRVGQRAQPPAGTRELIRCSALLSVACRATGHFNRVPPMVGAGAPGEDLGGNEGPVTLSIGECHGSFLLGPRE